MKGIVIGCGRMGERHVRALQELGINVCGLYDINGANVKRVMAANALPASVLASSVDDIWHKDKIDICVIATTAPSHKELVIKALESGVKKILCEKPLATSIADCEEIMMAAQKYSADVAVNHQMRYMEQYTIPKERLASEDFGGIQAIHVAAGNFGMAMNGLHYIEMMRFMFDGTPDTVNAWFDEIELSNPRGLEFKDKSGCLRITNKNGGRFYLDASVNNGHGVTVTYIGKYGQIIVDELSGVMYSTFREGHERNLPTTRYGQPYHTKTERIVSVDIVGSTKSLVQSFLSGQNYPTVADATGAINALAAAYVSNENGNCTVAMNDSRIKCERNFPWA